MLVHSALAAANLIAPAFIGVPRELVVTLHLTGAGAVLELVVEHFGDAGGVDLPIRSIVARALDLGSAGLVIAHNHPSGDPTPSEADRRATWLLADTARGIGLRLHDHLVFAGSQCRSFRAMGLL